MKYCSVCGGAVVLKIPEDDNRERFCCDSSGAIHNENPK
ncbi:MAG: zinc ribbon domain-containing protein, partial [Gammaproteobacteria bacterium]